jgi:hypothetical protein
MSEPVLLAEISPGELIDKITILEIKVERITDAGKLANVRYALERLRATQRRELADKAELAELTRALKRANEALWEIEDHIRDCERVGDFGARFIELARSVYRTNDRRAATKKAIDQLYGSAMTEEKSYQAY